MSDPARLDLPSVRDAAGMVAAAVLAVGGLMLLRLGGRLRGPA